MFMENKLTKAQPRRVNWRDPDDIEAMVYVALGQSARRILQNLPSLTRSQLSYRMKKAGLRISDYRNGTANTVGGQIAGELLQQARRRYRGLVADHLQQEPPTKKQTRKPAGHHGSGPQ